VPVAYILKCLTLYNDGSGIFLIWPSRVYTNISPTVNTSLAPEKCLFKCFSGAGEVQGLYKYFSGAGKVYINISPAFFGVG